MAEISNLYKFENLPKTVLGQSCVRAVFRNDLPQELKREAYKFISRNIIPDCQRVPPNCLKAHLIRTAKRLNFAAGKLNALKNLFRAKVGYNGYYLDSGKLKHI